MKTHFELYDVANDYSLSPVPGKYQFGNITHAKKQAQDLIDKWVAGMKTRAGKLSAYKIKWRRNPVSGTRDTKMEWIGSIHDGETVYRIIERRKNPVKKKTRKKNPERITQAWLDKRVALLNDMLGRPQSQYTKTASGITGNRGHLFIDHAYGGVKVAEMAGNGTGENNISDGYVPKKELNNFINGMIAAVRLIENKKRGRNPAKRAAHEKGFIIEDKTPRSCATMHKQIKGFMEHGRPGQIYECGKCHKQFVVPARKKNSASAYDGKGAHIVFIFNKDKLRYVGKSGKDFTLETAIGKAKVFKTLGAAIHLGQRIQFPDWAKKVGTMKASNPAKFAKDVQRTSYGGKA